MHVCLCVMNEGGSPSRVPRGADITTLRRDVTLFPRDIKRLYYALCDRVEEFRSLKRYISTHDPVPPEDRQLTILEALSVNVDQVRDTVATFIAASVEKVSVRGVVLSLGC